MSIIQPHENGLALARYIHCLAESRGHLSNAIHFADRYYRTTPSVGLALQARADVSAHDTTISGQLANYGIGDFLIQAIRGISALERLKPLMRRVPFRTQFARDASTNTVSAWVAEGQRKPVGRFDLDNVTIDNFKTSTVVSLTEELARLSRPAAVPEITRALSRGVASFLDSQFFDPTNTPSPGLRPGAITVGAQSHNSSGSSAAQIKADLQSMTALLGSWDSVRWVLHPATAAFIAGSDATLFAGLRATPDGGTLLGIPVLNSANVPETLITLLDAQSIMLADDDDIDISLSQHGSLFMDDGGSPSSTALTSLWQENKIGIRVERGIAWRPATDNGVVTMTVSYS